MSTKYDEAVLSTNETIVAYESEIQKLISEETRYVYGSYVIFYCDLLVDDNVAEVELSNGETAITYADSGELELDYTNIEIYKVTVHEDDDVTSPVVAIYNASEGISTTALDISGNGNSCKTSASQLKVQLPTSWLPKINTAKRMIRSRLTAHLSQYRSSQYPDPVALINNPEILDIASDLLVVSLVYNDVSQGEETLYGTKALQYSRAYEKELKNVFSALDLDTNGDDITDTYRYTRSTLLSRKGSQSTPSPTYY